jgi:hypothetical protein
VRLYFTNQVQIAFISDIFVPNFIILKNYAFN